MGISGMQGQNNGCAGNDKPKRRSGREDGVMAGMRDPPSNEAMGEKLREGKKTTAAFGRSPPTSRLRRTRLKGGNSPPPVEGWPTRQDRVVGRPGSATADKPWPPIIVAESRRPRRDRLPPSREAPHVAIGYVGQVGGQDRRTRREGLPADGRSRTVPALQKAETARVAGRWMKRICGFGRSELWCAGRVGDVGSTSKMKSRVRGRE